MTILYITYDGLLDPLGPSQILPYIKNISKHQGEVIVLSFEKPEREFHGKDALLLDLRDYSIRWESLQFTKGFGFFGKFYDLFRMFIKALLITWKYNIEIVHTRSHAPTIVGLFIKRISKAKLIFDCRGLWVDERVDKGGWNLNQFFDRLQYKYFKRVEKKLFFQADHVVVLTNKVVDEVTKLGTIEKSKITVIPCCADYSHFTLSTNILKKDARVLLGIPHDAFVLGYLGSIGKMYMLDRFFHLLKLAVNVRKDCYAFVITQNTSELKQLMKRHLETELISRVHIKSASRDEIPDLLPAIDVMVSFITSTYARQGASPTKMAESFASGIPVIANPGVGDVKQLVNGLDGGRMVDPFSDDELMGAVETLDTISSKGGKRLRDASQPILGLDHANKAYRSVYDALKKPNVIYVSYDGMLEPLGQSQILSYLKPLGRDYNISILSFEKKKDWLNEKNVDLVKTLMDQHSLEWTALSYTKRPLVLSTLYDLAKGICHVFYIARTRKVEIIHARSYIPALIALIVTRFIKLKFIFDMRGFWADERVEWGIWKTKNLSYLFFKSMEKQFFSKADAIVSLTKVGVDRMKEIVKIDETKVEIKVIPTCADLQLFSVLGEKPKKLVLAHVGTVETRYEFHRTLDIFKRLQKLTPCELHIINKGEHDYIKDMLKQNKIVLSDVKIFESMFSEMPNHLSKISFGAFFPKQGFYLNGLFPTKLGEFLACGRPLICGKVNEDVESIIKENKIGVIIDFEKDISVEDKLKELIDISNSIGIAEKCRKIAEKLFSVKQGARDYDSLYRNLLIQSLLQKEK